jgi:hypothetical protein
MGVLDPKDLVKKFEGLRERGVWDEHYREVATYFQPLRKDIYEEPAKGNKRHQEVFDNTGIQSNEMLAAALQSMLTNPSMVWFELTTGDEKLDDKDTVRQYLQDETLNLHNILNGTNFNTEVHQMYLDLCSFGTAPMSILEDEKTVVRFSTKHIKNVRVLENHKGVVDQLFCEYKASASQLVEEFGEEALPKEVMDAFNKDEAKEFCVIHASYPSQAYKGKDSRGGKGKFLPFVSQYVLKLEKPIDIKVGGFRSFPYVVPRWTKAAGEVYGRSPAMNALPDMKTLNKMTETLMIAAQKTVDPPLQLPDDGFILPIITRPGGLNFRRPGGPDQRIEPLFPPSRIDFGQDLLQDRRLRIEKSFFVDQLRMREGPQKTATEVLQITEENNRLLGPVLGRMQSEYLRPLIDRVYDIAAEQGKVLEAPEELAGRRIEVKYASMIARVQRVSEAQNVMRTFETVAPFIGLDQSVADIFDGEEIARIVARGFNFPQRGIRNKKDIEAIRKARAQAQQEMVEAQKEAQQAENISKVAPAMQMAQ